METTALTEDESHAELVLTLVLREKEQGPSLAHTLAWLDSQPPDSRRHLDVRRLALEHGFDERDFERVARWAREAGFRISVVDPATRRVTVHGPTGRMGRAFGVSLQRCLRTDPSGRTLVYRGHTGRIRMPAELDGPLDGVFGLDNRPLARPHLQRLAAPALVSYDPSELAE